MATYTPVIDGYMDDHPMRAAVDRFKQDGDPILGEALTRLAVVLVEHTDDAGELRRGAVSEQAISEAEAAVLRA